MMENVKLAGGGFVLKEDSSQWQKAEIFEKSSSERLPRNRNLKPVARTLRNGMTRTEKLLWAKIRKKQLGDFQFYRQKVIGSYIADFYCHKASLVIEVDGSQHYTPEGLKKDCIRDKYMSSLGLRILRFTNIEVLRDLEGVVERICEALQSSVPFKRGLAEPPPDRQENKTRMIVERFSEK